MATWAYGNRIWPSAKSRVCVCVLMCVYVFPALRWFHHSHLIRIVRFSRFSFLDLQHKHTIF